GAGVKKDWRLVVVQTKVQGVASLVLGVKEQQGGELGEVDVNQMGEINQWTAVVGRSAGRSNVAAPEKVISLAQHIACLKCVDDGQMKNGMGDQFVCPTSDTYDRGVKHQRLE
ncbi:hypothetical protein Dimus_033571, partial [Dionaea muscipula]